jgi:hypothetical protein
LLVEEAGFNLIHRTPSGYGPNYFWSLPGNVYSLEHAWDGSLSNLLTVAIAMMVFSALASLSISLACRDAARYLALSITIMASVVSILFFAYISETRVFIETIPICWWVLA